jgi:hypothetical protein
VKIQHLFNDSEGDSRFEEIDVEFSPVEFVPPAPPIDLPEFPDTASGVSRASAREARLERRPAPCRQLIYYLSGRVECETSNGKCRTIGPGSIVLLDETEAKGHRSSTVGHGT